LYAEDNEYSDDGSLAKTGDKDKKDNKDKKKDKDKKLVSYEASYGGFSGRGSTISAEVLPNNDFIVSEGFEFLVWGRDPDFNVLRFNNNIVFGAFDWMEISGTVPILIRKAKDQHITSEKGLGDMHGGVKFMIFPDDDQYMGLAVFTQATVPTGNQNKDLGGEWAIRGGFAFTENYGDFRLDGHFEYGWAKMVNTEGQKYKGSSFENYSFTFTFLPEKPVTFRICAVGSSKSSYIDYPVAGFRVVPGVRVMVMKDMFLDGGFAWGLDTPPEIGFNLGLSYRFGLK